MFTTIESFLNAWEFESAATLKYFAALSDAALKKAVAKDHRTLGRLAWHISQTIPEMMAQTGLKVTGPAHDTPPPRRKADLVKAYRAAAKSLAAQVKAHWSNATLRKKDVMYGETWTRGTTLHCLILHQVHHRGQMSVLMRQAGIRVPGIYGPAREDWASMGAPIPEV